MWEDEENKSGGGWLHQIPLQQYNKKTAANQQDVDELWKDTLLALIGDNFCGRDERGLPLAEAESSETNANGGGEEHLCENISGIYVCRRQKNDKLTLWTKNFKDEKSTRLIG